MPIMINNRYFLFYADIDEMDTEENVQYKEKGYYQFLYLCDLVEDKIYFINDLKLVTGLRDHLVPFVHNKQDYLVFNEAYMEDYESEYAYNDIKVDKDLFKNIEALYLISVSDFVESIKTGKRNIPFKLVRKRHIDGWVRYIEMDEQNIYFREKDFKTQIEKVYAINKTTLESTVVWQVNHKEITGDLFYGYKKYEEIKSDDYIKIRGLHNCEYDICLKKDKNIWIDDIINDRYLITYQWVEDEEDNYFEFVYIIDIKENNSTKYDGACKIYNSCVILYGGLDSYNIIRFCILIYFINWEEIWKTTYVIVVGIRR